MTSLSTTIKRQYFDAIVKGDKTTEYHATSPYWRKRIENKGLDLDSIVLICGKDVHKRQITMIQEVQTEAWLKGMVDTPTMYAIHLGLKVDKEIDDTDDWLPGTIITKDGTTSYKVLSKSKSRIGPRFNHYLLAIHGGN